MSRVWCTRQGRGHRGRVCCDTGLNDGLMMHEGGDNSFHFLFLPISFRIDRETFQMQCFSFLLLIRYPRVCAIFDGDLSL